LDRRVLFLAGIAGPDATNQVNVSVTNLSCDQPA
jgi:hypothetical protein